MKSCPRCRGSGMDGDDSCATCGGFGNIDPKEYSTRHEHADSDPSDNWTNDLKWAAHAQKKKKEEQAYNKSQRPAPEQATIKEYGEMKMNEGQGFALIKSARMGNQIGNKFNVPNQGNHQTNGPAGPSAPTMPQRTTPGLSPTGGLGNQMTRVQTNQNDRYNQAVTRQTKSNYGVGVGPGSGNNPKGIIDTNPYNTTDPDKSLGGYQNVYSKQADAFNKGPIGTGVSKIFSAIGKGLKGMFSDQSSPYKKSGNAEVACSDKKNMKFVGGSK